MTLLVKASSADEDPVVILLLLMLPGAALSSHTRYNLNDKSLSR